MGSSAYLHALAVPLWRRRSSSQAKPVAIGRTVANPESPAPEPCWLRGSEQAEVIFVLEHNQLNTDEQSLLEAITATQQRSVAWLVAIDESLTGSFADAQVLVFSDKSCEGANPHQQVPSLSRLLLEPRLKKMLCTLLFENDCVLAR